MFEITCLLVNCPCFLFSMLLLASAAVVVVAIMGTGVGYNLQGT